MKSESGSSVLYHKTGIQNAIDILKTQKLELTPTGRSSVETNMNRSYSYYMSFGRTSTAKYNKMSTFRVQMVFDGSTLATRHKITAVDYWGEDYRKHAGGEYEQEDRLLSDKPVLKLIGLVEMHCLLSDKMPDNQRRQVRALALLAKRTSTKLYVYTNEKAAQRMQRSASLPLAALNLKTDEPIKRWRERPERRDSGAHAVVELLLKKQGQQLSEHADRYLRYIRYGEFTTQYSIVLGNFLTGSEKERARIQDLISLTKKLRLQNAQEVANYIKKRWA
jgi:hypothetical protein